MKIFSRLDKHKYKNEIFKLMQNGFNEPLSWLEFFFKELFEKYEVFGVLENTKLISIAFVSDKTLIFNAQKFYCPLISYVTTDKNFLRQKNAFNLLAHIKKFYVQKNADGLYLCPTNPNVYISSGFEPFCYEKKIILNYDNKSSSKIRKANAADTNLLLELYNNFMVDKNGFCFRDEEYFKTVIKFMDFYIVYDRDKNLGYFATDGFYWELCADLKTLQGVKEMNAKEIFVPSLAQDENSVVSQMICAFNPLLKREIGKENINFDRYF